MLTRYLPILRSNSIDPLPQPERLFFNCLVELYSDLTKKLQFKKLLSELENILLLALKTYEFFILHKKLPKADSANPSINIWLTLVSGMILATKYISGDDYVEDWWTTLQRNYPVEQFLLLHLDCLEAQLEQVQHDVSLKDRLENYCNAAMNVLAELASDNEQISCLRDYPNLCASYSFLKYLSSLTDIKGIIVFLNLYNGIKTKVTLRQQVLIDKANKAIYEHLAYDPNLLEKEELLNALNNLWCQKKFVPSESFQLLFLDHFQSVITNSLLNSNDLKYSTLALTSLFNFTNFVCPKFQINKSGQLLYKWVLGAQYYLDDLAQGKIFINAIKIILNHYPEALEVIKSNGVFNYLLWIKDLIQKFNHTAITQRIKVRKFVVLLADSHPLWRQVVLEEIKKELKNNNMIIPELLQLALSLPGENNLESLMGVDLKRLFINESSDDINTRENFPWSDQAVDESIAIYGRRLVMIKVIARLSHACGLEGFQQKNLKDILSRFLTSPDENVLKDSLLAIQNVAWSDHYRESIFSLVARELQTHHGRIKLNFLETLLNLHGSPEQAIEILQEYRKLFVFPGYTLSDQVVLKLSIFLQHPKCNYLINSYENILRKQDEETLTTLAFLSQGISLPPVNSINLCRLIVTFFQNDNFPAIYYDSVEKVILGLTWLPEQIKDCFNYLTMVFNSTDKMTKKTVILKIIAKIKWPEWLSQQIFTLLEAQIQKINAINYEGINQNNFMFTDAVLILISFINWTPTQLKVIQAFMKNHREFSTSQNYYKAFAQVKWLPEQLSDIFNFLMAPFKANTNECGSIAALSALCEINWPADKLPLILNLLEQERFLSLKLTMIAKVKWPDDLLPRILCLLEKNLLRHFPKTDNGQILSYLDFLRSFAVIKWSSKELPKIFELLSSHFYHSQELIVTTAKETMASINWPLEMVTKNPLLLQNRFLTTYSVVSLFQFHTKAPIANSLRGCFEYQRQLVPHRMLVIKGLRLNADELLAMERAEKSFYEAQLGDMINPTLLIAPYQAQEYQERISSATILVKLGFHVPVFVQTLIDAIHQQAIFNLDLPQDILIEIVQLLLSLKLVTATMYLKQSLMILCTRYLTKTYGKAILERHSVKWLNIQYSLFDSKFDYYEKLEKVFLNIESEKLIFMKEILENFYHGISSGELQMEAIDPTIYTLNKSAIEKILYLGSLSNAILIVRELASLITTKPEPLHIDFEHCSEERQIKTHH